MLTTIFVGYDTVHDKDFVYDIPNGLDCWVVLLTHTPAEFLIDGKMKLYPAGCAVVFAPYQKTYYRAYGDNYSDDWLRFYTDETFIINSEIPLGVPFSIPDTDFCHNLYKLISSENFFHNTYRKLSIEYLLKTLMNKLIEAVNYDNDIPQYQHLLGLREAIHNAPWDDWTVSKMATRLHISEGYLQTIYKRAFEVSCIEDVIHSRINLAKELLLRSSYTIEEIAGMCGYNNSEHFCRQFKQIVSLTPNSYRKKEADTDN